MASSSFGFGRGGGRHSSHNRATPANNNSSSSSQPKFQVCRNYIATGTCPHGQRCNFNHFVRHYATLDVSDKLLLQSQQHHPQHTNRHHHHHANSHKIKDRYKATSVALWPTGGGMKLFVGSHDGKWRLYSTSTATISAVAAAATTITTGSNSNNNNNSNTSPINVSITQEFEHHVGGPIDTLHLLHSSSSQQHQQQQPLLLFVGFEVTSPLEAPLDTNKAGMVHIWNLNAPSNPPLELQLHTLFAKYASSGKIRCLCTPPPAPTTASTNTITGVPTMNATFVRNLEGRVWSGGNDGVIREWAMMSPNQPHHLPPLGGGDGVGLGGGSYYYQLVRSMSGHIGAVTKLILSNHSPDSVLLWSGGIDGTIRLWNLETGDMAHLIPSVKKEISSNNTTANNATTTTTRENTPIPTTIGHSGAITGMLPFVLPANDSITTSGGGGGSSPFSSFVFTSSLDETVKVWDATNGNCVATEKHGQGVTSIAFTTTTTNASTTTTQQQQQQQQQHPLLICGLYYGDIMIRGTITTPPLVLLLKISHNFVGVGHELGPIHDIQSGPEGTFYAVGEDGKLTVWQISNVG